MPLLTLLIAKRDPGTYQKESWVSTRVHADALEKVEISCPCQESNYYSLAIR
jgi:hypothetical protein